MDSKAAAQKMMALGNPALLTRLRDSGRLSAFLAEIEATADDLFATEVIRLRKAHPPASPTLVEQQRTEAQAIAGAKQTVIETVIAPLGRPGIRD